MKAVLQLFLQICLLRASPSAVPTIGWFVAAIVVANFVVSVALNLVADASTALLNVVVATAVAQATIAAMVYFALHLREVASRFIATVTALFGCDALITALYVATLPAFALISDDVARNSVYPFSIWSIAVAGYILHQALNTSLAVGIAIGFGISLVGTVFSQAAIA